VRHIGNQLVLIERYRWAINPPS